MKTNTQKFVCDDMILTTDAPTTAGSMMLDGYVSLFESEALSRAKAAGYTQNGKTPVGEFSFDTIGESSYNADCSSNGKIVLGAANAILSGDADTALCLDVNGSVRRGAAQSGLVSIKPTYGTVSRFGTVPVACSGECVSVMAKTADDAFDMLCAISGHDDKDGTSLPEEKCALIKDTSKTPKKAALLTSMLCGIDDEVKAKTDSFVNTLKASGIEVCEIDDSVICKANIAWNVLMCAELCNNVSKYDGVKYGYRAENFSGIDELYTNSRTEAFGELLKTAILYGSDALSTENYMKVYDKSLRVRRVIVEAFKAIFETYDAVIMPACSKMSYSDETFANDKYFCFKENFYTAPASITGLPAIALDGVQLVGEAFSEGMLINIAKIYEKEGK